MCVVKIEHNYKQKMCNFFKVLGDGQALLGMPDIDTLKMINRNVNTVEMEDGRGTNNCCTNKATPQAHGMKNIPQTWCRKQTELRCCGFPSIFGGPDWLCVSCS